MQFAEEVEKLAESGDPDWLKKIEEYMNSDGDIDNIKIDDNFVKMVEKGLGE